MQLNVRSEHFYCAWFSIRESCLCQNLDQFSVQMVESVSNNSGGCVALCGVRMLMLAFVQKPDCWHLFRNGQPPLLGSAAVTILSSRLPRYLI